RKESQSGAAKVAHDEAAAEDRLASGLEALGLAAKSLQNLPKGAPEKLVIAWWLRENTTVSLRWLSERLKMGHYTRVTQAVQRVTPAGDSGLETMRRKLLALK